MLRPLLGINEKGEYKLYMLPYSLNEMSPMHKRGARLTNAVTSLMEGSKDPEQAIQALEEATKYYQDHESPTKKK